MDLQKASLIKRASAFLFDIIIFFVAAAGMALTISAAVGYDAKLGELEDMYIKYSEEYGIELGITEEKFNELSDAEKENYQLASSAFATDKEVTRLNSIIFSLTLVILSFALLIPTVLLEIAVPLVFKNGQTLGKKIFGICLMRTDCVKVSFFQLFVRAILGKYTIELMVPVLLTMMFLMGTTGFIGILVVGMILLLQICVMIFTSTNSTIHDLLAVTAVVDYNTQRIFESTEKMLEYKKKKAEQEALAQKY